MPKLALPPDEKRKKELKSVIKKYMELRDCTPPELARAMGLCSQSYYNRMRNLDSLSLGELRAVKRRLKIPAEEILFIFN